jgi:D-arabinose 1-dehydrogenase-like Zn-dependent alcohol dehydrogenase
VVKSVAVAINPVDYGQQMYGPAFFSWMKIPCVLGYDVAGEVSAVSSGITKFKEGDRVIGLASPAFQNYTIVEEHVAAILPSTISFEDTAVISLGYSVAVKGLYSPELLALPLPTIDVKSSGKAILIFGGSSSVGSNAVQLAKASSYEVISTASPANFAYVKSLGASEVFDHNNPTVKEDLIAAFKSKEVVGAFTNGAPRPEANLPIVETCAAVLLSSTTNRKFVAMTMKDRWPIPEGVKAEFILPLRGDMELAGKLFNNYLPNALEAGAFVPSPPPLVTERDWNLSKEL